MEERIMKLQNELAQREAQMPGLSDPVEVSISNASIQEFVRAMAMSSGLNLGIDQSLTFRVTNNFADAPVKDILIYLCKEYALDLDFTGQIISLKPYVAPEVVPVKLPAKALDISYGHETGLVSINVKNDTLFEVAKRITQLSDYNVVVSPGSELQTVSAFIKNRPFEIALENFAFANGLVVRRKDGNFFILDKANDEEREAKPKFGSSTSQITPHSRPQAAGVSIQVSESNTLSIKAENAGLEEIIKIAAYESGAHYYMFESPTKKTSLFVENASFDELLSYLFGGTEYTYKKSADVYLIGMRNQERLRTTELVSLNNRAVEQVVDAIPLDLKKGLDIKEFSDLNSLIITGSYTSIEEVKSFLHQIDRPVPVVIIDIMIVEVNKDFNLETGLKFSLGGDEVPSSTSGQYNNQSPGLQATLTSRTVNSLLQSFTTPGMVNLGTLSPNFYASLKALETNGVIRRKSTPKLATMNGSEASLTLGEQTFYAETNNSFIGAQNPALSESIIYKPISADLTITIKPSVSADEQITLDIAFSQSSFTNRIGETAPPGSFTKSFNSKIRVRNGETVLLGGLDEEETEKTGEGLPILARIPVLKWIFGSNTRRDSKSQINIFIQPRVVY
ncbi:MAG: hypothetical protein RIF46_01415 [Cyclobacteriaceae bacterium]